MRKVAPEVRLFVDQRVAALTADGSVQVYFILRSDRETDASKVWSEDDTVSLVCSSRAGQSQSMGDCVFYKEDEQPYEAFEYTDAPRTLPSITELSQTDKELLRGLGALEFLSTPSKSATSGKSVHFYFGQVTLKLPSFGGCFHVSYVRTLTLPANAVTITRDSSGSSGKVVQRRVRLAHSESLLPRVALHGAHPDARTAAVSVLFAAPSAPSITKSTTTRRRGAGAIANSAQTQVTGFVPVLSMWVEDLSHIKTLNVITTLRAAPVHSTVTTIARTMAWVQTSATTPHTLKLTVEVDVLTARPGDDSASDAEVRTVYGEVEVTDSIFERSSLDLSSAYGQLDEEGRFVCRLPYTPHSVPSGSRRGAGATATESKRTDATKEFVQLSAVLDGDRSADSTDRAAMKVQCAFCRAEVVAEDSVNQLRPLPTGLLDNVMLLFSYLTF